MDNFSYNNIFDTKGIEYVAIIIFFLILIPFWIILNRQSKITNKLQEVINILTFEILKIPQGVFLAKNHTWMYLEKSGNASIGLDDFLLHTTGNVKLQHHKQVGDKINKGDILTEIVSENSSLKIVSPVTGEVKAVNINLNETPQIMNEDPFGKGWVYKIKPSNWVDETKSCYLAEDAVNWSKNEMQRFKDFLALSTKKYMQESPQLILQDGGELLDHSLTGLSGEVWHDFQERFLDVT
jgi:glycine cleavage system H protein